MLAVVPAGPNTSYCTNLGLNCTISTPAPEPALGFWEPKIPGSRSTMYPEAASTTANTMGIHARLSQPAIGVTSVPHPSAHPIPGRLGGGCVRTPPTPPAKSPPAAGRPGPRERSFGKPESTVASLVGDRHDI